MDNIKSSYRKDDSQESWEMTVKDGDITKCIKVEQAKNGYIITKNTYGYKNKTKDKSGDYFDETEKWISKTNPLEENKKDSKKTESSGNDMNAKFLEMINSSKLNLNI